MMAVEAEIFLPKGSQDNRKLYHPARAFMLVDFLSKELSSPELLEVCDAIFSAFHIDNKNIASVDVLLELLDNTLKSKEEFKDSMANLLAAAREALTTGYADKFQAICDVAKQHKEREVGVPQLHFSSFVLSGKYISSTLVSL